jgi:amino acid transporter
MAEQTSSSIFVRKSSGLVREASAFDAMIFNAVFSAPVGATLAFGIFYALGAFPGADLVTALLIAFVVNIPVCIMMSMMASSMPRTGGDAQCHGVSIVLRARESRVHGEGKQGTWI